MLPSTCVPPDRLVPMQKDVWLTSSCSKHLLKNLRMMTASRHVLYNLRMMTASRHALHERSMWRVLA